MAEIIFPRSDETQSIFRHLQRQRVRRYFLWVDQNERAGWKREEFEASERRYNEQKIKVAYFSE